jgi:hypothetical protein
MMFIKTTFALYFAAIALAAPTPQVGIVGETLGGAGGLVNGVLGVFTGAFGLGNSVLSGLGSAGGRGGGGNGWGGRLRTSCLNSCPLSTSLIRPTIAKHVGDTVDQVNDGAPLPDAPGIPGSTD